jgi:hypothetical protein
MDMMGDLAPKASSPSSNDSQYSSNEHAANSFYGSDSSHVMDVDNQSTQVPMSEPQPLEALGRKQAGDASGQVILGTKETTYIGATHWAAILSDVRKLLISIL